MVNPRLVWRGSIALNLVGEIVASEHDDPSFEAANALASRAGIMGRRPTGRRANRADGQER
jgi:hypothetical protein